LAQIQVCLSLFNLVNCNQQQISSIKIMKTLRIPQQYQSGINLIIKIDEILFNKLVNAITEVNPFVNIDSIVLELSAQIEEISIQLHKPLLEETGWTHKLSKISFFYRVENVIDVHRFLQKHSNLIDVLLEAHRQIRKYFPTEKLRLKLYVDPESPQWEKLVLSICASAESVDQALNQLDELDENWWIDASLGVAVNLCIHLDFE
jgi:hypothetical protein